MDLALVVAALASVGVRVSGSTPNSNVQGDSSRACPTGLAGRVGKDGVYIRVTYIYAYCIARIQYSTRLVPRLASGASRGRR